MLSRRGTTGRRTMLKQSCTRVLHTAGTISKSGHNLVCLFWLCPELVVYNSRVHVSGEVATTTWYTYSFRTRATIWLSSTWPHRYIYQFCKWSDRIRSVSVFLVLPLWLATRLNNPTVFGFTYWSLKLWCYLCWQTKMRTALVKWKDLAETWGKWDGWTHGSKPNIFHCHFAFENSVIESVTKLPL